MHIRAWYLSSVGVLTAFICAVGKAAESEVTESAQPSPIGIRHYLATHGFGQFAWGASIAEVIDAIGHLESVAFLRVRNGDTSQLVAMFHTKSLDWARERGAKGRGFYIFSGSMREDGPQTPFSLCGVSVLSQFSGEQSKKKMDGALAREGKWMGPFAWESRESVANEASEANGLGRSTYYAGGDDGKPPDRPNGIVVRDDSALSMVALNISPAIYAETVSAAQRQEVLRLLLMESAAELHQGDGMRLRLVREDGTSTFEDESPQGDCPASCSTNAQKRNTRMQTMRPAMSWPVLTGYDRE